MGGVLSSVRAGYDALNVFWAEVSQNMAESDALLRRIATPAFPVADPTVSFWQLNPPFPKLVKMKSKQLPQSADIVIIGSGLSGASVAYTILSECHALGAKKKVVILEARETCSGATGRNGGHLKCSPYMLYSDLKGMLSPKEAREVLKFYRRHLPIMLDLVEAERLEGAEAREVETVDVFLEKSAWEKGLGMVRDLRQDFPEAAQDIMVWEADDAKRVQKFGLSSHAHGAITYRAGAMWPYRLVSSLYSHLLAKYGPSFAIETSTEVQDIHMENDEATPYYLRTSRGVIRARHIVHATDGFTANLIPGLKGKIFPVRGHMSAQEADGPSSDLDGTRSWSFIDKKGFEYITQRPQESAGCHSPGGEIMLGGGLFQSADKGLDEIGIWKDNGASPIISAYLSGIWSVAMRDENTRVLQLWTGCMGFTIDLLPFVGRVHPRFTGRVPHRSSRRGKSSENSRSDAPNEWITAGFGGDGMVSAWLSGTAVGLMLLGRDKIEHESQPGRPAGKVTDWLPKQLRLSGARIRRANIYKLAQQL
ncbi:nucleotide-binding domain-containing protein [Aspergillus steynii IBT 23096]|uniref:Nucleotide-binding domain-containing protein n=1 Tax=Aspergillus steynii IBT 23096 TaxID=1392250 RepID=A0A2I2GI93_9EURO|nr:nucleotide-binding domain-containing protein [Aspergillus steynii IBT 23096]PLB52599.1 nucleotide-binding domain-containing protein [Aspergillus steynii IBT 23096]